MVDGLIGIKVGMTQVFDENGIVVPVTVIKAGPCVVVQKKTKETDGYECGPAGSGRIYPSFPGEQAESRAFQKGWGAALPRVAANSVSKTAQRCSRWATRSWSRRFSSQGSGGRRGHQQGAWICRSDQTAPFRGAARQPTVRCSIALPVRLAHRRTQAAFCPACGLRGTWGTKRVTVAEPAGGPHPGAGKPPAGQRRGTRPQRRICQSLRKRDRLRIATWLQFAEFVICNSQSIEGWYGGDRSQETSPTR